MRSGSGKLNHWLRLNRVDHLSTPSVRLGRASRQ
jgi:hypothetical protein